MWPFVAGRVLAVARPGTPCEHHLAIAIPPLRLGWQDCGSFRSARSDPATTRPRGLRSAKADMADKITLHWERRIGGLVPGSSEGLKVWIAYLLSESGHAQLVISFLLEGQLTNQRSYLSVYFSKV